MLAGGCDNTDANRPPQWQEVAKHATMVQVAVFCMETGFGVSLMSGKFMAVLSNQKLVSTVCRDRLDNNVVAAVVKLNVKLLKPY